MIQYLKHSQIDKSRWNNAIANSINEYFYAYSWYLDIVSPNWEALVYDDYQIVMPLTCKKKFSINYLYNPFFVQQLGLFSNKQLGHETIHLFLDNIPSTFKLIEINLNYANEIIDLKYNPQKNNNYELALNTDYSILQSNYSNNTKRNLSKAYKNNLIISENVTAQSIIDLFKYDRGKNISSLNEKEYSKLLLLIDELQKHVEVLITGVCNDSKHIIAGAILIKTKSKITFLFSGNSIEGKQKFAMFYLIDSMIQKHANSNLIFDFEGSNNEGIANFYKSFGAKNVPYNSIKINKLPKAIRWLK